MSCSVVVIGRNEGHRLARCLHTVLQQTDRIVYVDSASRDGSSARAAALGVACVALDASSLPLSAARARNAGVREALRRWPDTDVVQFLDGDMELVRGWLDAAEQHLRDHRDVVAVFGWRRERGGGDTIFNRICDVEWRLSGVGLQQSFGGDVLMCVAAFEAVGGYDARVIAAEDDELALRLRADGGVIERIDVLSTFHHAAMTRPAQWWTRARRTGYAYAQVRAATRATEPAKFRPQLRRAYVFGLALPAAALALAPMTFGGSLPLLAFYPINAARIGRGLRQRGFDRLDAVAWGVSCALAVVPQAMGALQHERDRALKRAARIIEHKHVGASR